MGILNILGIKKEKRYPKNLIGFDFVKLTRNEDSEIEAIRYNELKRELSEKIYKINSIKLFKLSKAEKVIKEFQSLEKEIWG